MDKYRIAFIATEDYACSRVIESIKRLGHEVIHLHPDDLSVALKDNKPVLIYEGKQVIAEGIIHKMSTDFKDGLACLDAVEDQYVILNHPDAALTSANKFLAAVAFSENGIARPKCVFTQSVGAIKEASKEFGFPLIVKQSDGAEGNEVGLAKKEGDLEEVLRKIQEKGKNIIVQECIRESLGQDLRIIVVGDKVVAAMRRVQRNPNEFRANIHKGAVGEKVDFTPEEEKQAIAATKAIGLDFAGVDILRSKRGPLVIETNSFPGLEGIEKASDKDVAIEIVNFLIEKISQFSKLPV